MRYVRAIMLGITLLALFGAGVGYVILREVQSPVSTTVPSNEPVVIEIVEGDTTGDIATKLASAGLIRQPLVFTTIVRLEGLDGQLQRGIYVLQPSMSLSEILVALQNSGETDIQVTIPEGLRLEEIAARLADTGIIEEEEFIDVARNGIAFRDDYFLLNTLPADASLEGYLFPDTYNISVTATATDTVRMMLDNFNRRYSTIERSVQVPDATVHDVVTMAAIVQREAAVVAEMPTIAAVFWNRLKPEHLDETGGGRLQSDPTVQYALGYSAEEQTWWRSSLTAEDLLIDDPYNTREQSGLPPGPISNPGLDALSAAAQPDQSAEYLYMVADCAFDGTHNFAVTFDEFRQYEADFLACSSGASNTNGTPVDVGE